ncbi:hypothetical protein BELL_0168g00240 [Botrytis elliptica]|uniref:mannan endo-1,4-beta-mannosidase n=1 Tax=Botrytis elliptica TaxID=278938 RepID=A0A4Z1K4D6_9HELO|nr:hypothetical protein EAE99_009501 [Botrytis elliptica]TGO76223.1 hypothetical protein BELL_0168g00240 [Botrytis elliptica]
MKVSIALITSCAVALVRGQAAGYAKCGGQGWTGPTTCVTGYTCVYSNEFYSQCMPGSASTTLTTSTKPATTSTTSTTKPGTTSSTSTTAAPASTATSITGYAKTAGTVFQINGKKTYFAGTNCYWCGFLTNNADVDLVMSHLASSGLKVLRVWGFNDVTTAQGSGSVWYQSFIAGQSPVINTGANGLQRLDYVVQSAQAHGISLIINFVNNWNDYGGMQAYATYYGISLTDWYTNAAAQAQYKAYIAAVVARYKTNTAVFAWELANEPRCTGCATSVITNWATSISQYIKSLDPNHMVTVGDEGFGLTVANDTSYPFTAGPGTWFTDLLAIPTIDFATIHLYPGSWGEVDSWGSSWISSHANVTAAAGKPLVLEEYGSPTHLNELPWQGTVLDTATAGSMYWQYGDTLSTGKTSDDGNTIYYGTSEYTTLVTNHAAALNAKAVP